MIIRHYYNVWPLGIHYKNPICKERYAQDVLVKVEFKTPLFINILLGQKNKVTNKKRWDNSKNNYDENEREIILRANQGT